MGSAFELKSTSNQNPRLSQECCRIFQWRSLAAPPVRRAALYQSPPRDIQQYVTYQHVQNVRFWGFVTSLQIALKQPPVWEK
jgi:hypothetical protein